MQNSQTPKMSCPHIGLNYDKATYSNFPSINNTCYHVQPVVTPALSHQYAYCLTNNFSECPVYTSPEGNKLPLELQQLQEKKTNKKLNLLILGFSMVVILGTLLGIYWNNNKATTISVSQSPTNNQTIASTALRSTNTRAATNTSTMTLTELTTTPTLQVNAPQVTPSPSPTPTEVRVFQLDHEIGKNPQFIIHRTNEGESLPLFANIYQTSVEAIRAVNYDLPRILWPDQIVIIPLNQTDITGIPPFIAYEVEEDSVSFDQIAEELSILLEDLLQYNNVQGDYPLHQGDWILIPQINN